MNHIIDKICDECGSAFMVQSSKMPFLCCECAHHIYGYAPCSHQQINGSCKYCGWDGSESNFIKELKKVK